MRLTIRNNITRIILIVLCFFVFSAKASDEIFSCLDAKDGLCDNMVLQMLQLSDGRMIITTAGNVNMYDGFQFSYIHKKDNYYFPITSYRGFYHLYLDKNDRLWVKDWQKLLCMDIRNMSYTKNIKSYFKRMGVNEKINDFFIDSQKNIWLITDRGLLNFDLHKYYNAPKDAGNLLDLDTDRNKLYLFYQDGEVVCIDMHSRSILYRVSAYKKEEQAMFGNTSLVVKGPDNIFYQLRNGTKSGFFSFNTNTRKWKKLMQKDYAFHTLVVTKHNRAFITCPKGYWNIDLNNNKYTYNDRLKLSDGTVVTTGLNTMCIDKQGGLWFGTYNRGILYASPYKSAFSLIPNYKPDKPVINNTIYHGKRYNTVYRDSRGWVWCGTNDGLRLFIGNSEKTYYTEDGLCNNLVHSIIEDKKHHLWVSTSYGISEIKIGKKPYDLTFINFQKENGIQKHDYINGMAICKTNGIIMLQGVDGWTIFNPDSIRLPNYRINPLLINVYIQGKKYDINKPLRLDYKNNSLSFDFSALNYIRPEQTFYRYRLENKSDKWNVISANQQGGAVDSKGILHLSFVELPPGKYTLQVMASMNKNQWQGEIKTISFEICAPWWDTTAAHYIYGILCILILSISVAIYIKKMRVKMMEKHREEMTMMKNEMVFVSKVTAFVEQNISNSKYSVELLSKDMCMDRTGLYKKLSALLDKSPTMFIRDIRLEHAAKLLRNGTMNISEIAEAVGFSSSSYLSKCFQDKYGCKPSEYK